MTDKPASYTCKVCAAATDVLERQAADAQASAKKRLDLAYRIENDCRDHHERAVRAEEALRQTRPLVMEVRDYQQWTPMSGARRDWAVEILAEIDALLAAAGADTGQET